jgi:hypothetical protein
MSGKGDKPRLHLETATAAFDRNVGGRCECGCGRRAEQWHHVFRQQNWPELVDEVDNIVAVATYCHRRHTQAVERLPRSICHRAERLADERMLGHLDRTYGALV